MRHRVQKHKLGRPADQRKALIRSQITSLFLYKKLKTTSAKARALVSEIEKLITKVKRQDEFNAIRELNKVIYTKEASKKALEYINGTVKLSGFTRNVKMLQRAGDCALSVHVELL